MKAGCLQYPHLNTLVLFLFTWFNICNFSFHVTNVKILSMELVNDHLETSTNAFPNLVSPHLTFSSAFFRKLFGSVSLGAPKAWMKLNVIRSSVTCLWWKKLFTVIVLKEESNSSKENFYKATEKVSKWINKIWNLFF